MIVFKLLGPRETSSPGSLELRKCSNMSLLRQPSILENTGKGLDKALQDNSEKQERDAAIESSKQP